MQYADDQNAIGDRFVEDNVVLSHGETAKIGGQPLDALPEQGIGGQQTITGVDFVDQFVGGFRMGILDGDVVPDGIEITDGGFGLKNLRHGLLSGTLESFHASTLDVIRIEGYDVASGDIVVADLQFATQFCFQKRSNLFLRDHEIDSLSLLILNSYGMIGARGDGLSKFWG